MVEPAGPDRNIAFGGEPDGSVFVADVQSLFVSETGKRPLVVARRPVGLACEAPLVPYPADIGSRVAEDHCAGLQAFDRFEEAMEVIDHPFLAVIRTVEPRFEDHSILGANLAPLIFKDAVIFGPAVKRMIAVPRRDINAEFQVVCPASL